MIENHETHEMTRKLKAPVFPQTDHRLLGTWKSDRKRTFREWSYVKRLSAGKKRRFQSLFGKLEIKYARDKIIMRLRHRRWQQARRYMLVASDATSVAIVHYGPRAIKARRKYDPINLKLAEEVFGCKPLIQHIHFDQNHYWISLGNGRNREFFRKIPVKKRSS